MMRRLLMALVMTTGLAAAEGAHYDFYQKNGQNVLGAEIVAESETEFSVRLSYVPKPIKILKANLAREPALSAVQPKAIVNETPFFQYEFSLHAAAGYAFFNAGPVAAIFGSGYRATIGADWLLFREPTWRIHALTLNLGFSRFQEAQRYIQIADLQIGPKLFIYHFASYGISFYGTPLLSLAQVNLKGYTFESAYINLAGAIALLAEKKVGPVNLVLQLNVNSLFDKSQVFTATALSLAAAYPLTAGALK